MTVQPEFQILQGRQPHVRAHAIGENLANQRTQANPFSPTPFDATPLPAWGIQILCTILVSYLTFLAFGDDSSSVINRQSLRLSNTKLDEIIILRSHLIRAMPWESTISFHNTNITERSRM